MTLFFVTPQVMNCRWETRNFPFIVPAWFMCSINSRSMTRRSLTLNVCQALDDNNSRVSQTQGSSAGGRDACRARREIREASIPAGGVDLGADHAALPGGAIISSESAH